jgi:hypothetical protein
MPSPRPALAIVPGGGQEIRERVSSKLCKHSVPFLPLGMVLEVKCVYEDTSIPIFSPLRTLDGVVANLVEGWPITVWVTGNAEAHRPATLPALELFVYTAAHWLWELTEDLRSIGQDLAEGLRELWIEIDLGNDEAWADGEVAEPSNRGGSVVSASIDPDRGALRIQLGESSSAAFYSDTNAAERELLKTIMLALVELRNAICDSETLNATEAAEKVLDLRAPLGRKKKLILTGAARDPRFKQVGLPVNREVLPELIESVRYDVAADLFARGYAGTTLRGAAAVELLNTIVVPLLLEWIESQIASLHPDGLLERLVSMNERYIHDWAKRSVSGPAELEVYATPSELAGRFVSEQPNQALSALSCRFLIEYITARPPSGLRPFSLTVFDRLMALASELVLLGRTSDLLHLAIADGNLVVMADGQLSYRDAHYDAGMTAFTEAFAIGELSRDTAAFASHWADTEVLDSADSPREFQQAALDEFGLTFDQLSQVAWALLGDSLDNPAAPGSTRVGKLHDIVESLNGAIGMDREGITRALEVLMLGPRTTFMPTEGKKSDVFPWRFNRDLSYVRRPLLLRNNERGAELIWAERALFVSFNYLIRILGLGQFAARGKSMRVYMGKARSEQGHAFAEEVAKRVQRPGMRVFIAKDSFGKQRMERVTASGRREAIGDIDVLLVDTTDHRLYAIEAKNLAGALDAYQLAHELAGIFRTGGARPSDVERHLERLSWMKSHLAEVMGEIGLSPTDASDWTVEGLVVTNRELISQFIVPQAIRVITLRELESRLDSGTL